MTQDELKRLVGQAAVDYLSDRVPEGAVIGVGTGSTVNCFIDALAPTKKRYRGAVSSSVATTQCLEAHGIPVFDPNDIEEALPVYVDGADEIDPSGAMIKGGGGALTREKIVASMAQAFICIADGGKRVPVLGNFPLPVEVVPMACRLISRRFLALGGRPVIRVNQGQAPYITDNGNQIIDVSGLHIIEPRVLEMELSAWPGIVTVGLFAARGADVCLLGTEQGIETIQYRGV